MYLSDDCNRDLNMSRLSYDVILLGNTSHMCIPLS